MVLCGEFMNKSQRGADRKVFNAKFVIFDIIVYNGKHLKDSTFWERQTLLDSLYEVQKHDQWINKIYENIFRVKNLEENLEQEWKDIVNVEMYEGFVLKKREGKLEQSFKQKNNIGWQVKIRKPTKNYKY
jgi:ATP-dependent DNA ligase